MILSLSESGMGEEKPNYPLCSNFLTVAEIQVKKKAYHSSLDEAHSVHLPINIITKLFSKFPPSIAHVVYFFRAAQYHCNKSLKSKKLGMFHSARGRGFSSSIRHEKPANLVYKLHFQVAPVKGKHAYL